MISVHSTVKYLFLFLGLFSASASTGQSDSIYHWHPKKDAAIMITSGLIWGGSEHLKSISPEATYEDIMRLNRDNLWGIDRGTTDNLSPSSAKWSDYILYGSITLPFVQLAGKRAREYTGVIMGMTLEAYLLNDGITNLLKATTHRFRPYTYNPLVDMDDKLDTNARYSFASGHTSNVAMLTFFSAKVFTDLYPESKFKPVVWAGAITVPALTAYLRTRAGRHFPTDVITGYAIGAAVGVLIPHLHKISTHEHKFGLTSTGSGIMLTYNRTLK